MLPTGPVYWGNPPVRMALVGRPLGVDPQGDARWLVVTKFYDANGKPTRVMANGNVDWSSPNARVQWQTRLRFGQPAAILRTTNDGVMSLQAHSTIPNLPPATIQTNTRLWRTPRVVAQALGPRTVQIGWFPQETQLTRIVRIRADGNRITVAVIAGKSSFYRDTAVEANTSYHYIVYRSGYAPVKLRVTTPPAPPSSSISNFTGKAMWLYFTTNPLDPIYFRNLHPRLIAAQAAAAHLHYVELRVAYGAYWEITPEARPVIDAIIDDLSREGIGTIGWTVPRDATFEDEAATVRAAYYRTSRGTPLAGIAIDLERGGDFMGDSPLGTGALWQYARDVRNALGNRYVIAANVEDPVLEQLTDASYPYAQIAPYVSLMQPMTYWRMRGRTSPQQVRATIAASYYRVRALAGRNLPLSIGGQTAALGSSGAPSAPEITASLEASRSLGALGEIFFAWDGTQPAQWNAIASYAWP